MSLLLLFVNSSATTALSGQQMDARCGIIRADWHIESQQGNIPLVLKDVPLVGAEITSAAGDLDNETITALLGAFITGETGIVTPESGSPDISLELSGILLSTALGTMGTLGGLSAENLEEIQRQRRFGRSVMPFARSPVPRKVR